jgi:hypothetical protein
VVNAERTLRRTGDAKVSHVEQTDLVSVSKLTRATAHMIRVAEVSDHLDVHASGLAQSDLASVSKLTRVAAHGA